MVGHCYLLLGIMTFLRSEVNQFKRVINFLFVGHDFFLLCKFTYKWLAPLVSLKSSCNPIRANVSSIAVTLAFLCARGMNLWKERWARQGVASHCILVAAGSCPCGPLKHRPVCCWWCCVCGAAEWYFWTGFWCCTPLYHPPVPFLALLALLTHTGGCEMQGRARKATADLGCTHNSDLKDWILLQSLPHHRHSRSQSPS